MNTETKVKARLEYLRGELRGERISTGELLELQSLANHIAPDDVELLEAAGVPEHADTQTKTQFTPGPWRSMSRGMTDNSLVVVTEDWNFTDGHEEICCLRPSQDRAYGDQNNKDIANARLIAAAPEMFEALEAMVEADAIQVPSERAWAKREAKIKAYAVIANVKGGAK